MNGFLASNGAKVDEIEIEEINGVPYVFIRRIIPGKMTVDLLVLMIGIEASEGTTRIGEQVGVNGEYNFSKSISLHTADNKTKHQGFFLAGTCKRPLTVPETMADARAAALEIDLYLKSLSQ